MKNLIAVALLLCLSGCASDNSKPGGPSESTGLLSMSVYDSPVMNTTPWLVPSDSLQSENEVYTIVVPDSLLLAFTRVDDIALQFDLKKWDDQPTVEIFDYELEDWRTVNPWVRDALCPGLLPGPMAYLSAFSDDPFTVFVGPNRELLLRGEIDNPQVRLSQYNPEYQTVKLALLSVIHGMGRDQRWFAIPIWPIPRGIAIRDGLVWIVISYPRPCSVGGSGWRDHLFIVDSTGIILERTKLDGPAIVSITMHGGVIWAVTDDGRSASTISRDGTVTERFQLPNEWEVEEISSLVSAMGRLFLLDHAQGKLRGLLLEESIMSGEAAIDWPFTFGVSLSRYGGIAWDGDYFYLRDGNMLTQHNLSRQETGRWGLPVESKAPSGPSVRSLASDGDSFWMLHFGAVDHIPPGLMLSRFRIP